MKTLDQVYKELKIRGFRNQRDCFKQGAAFGYELRKLEEKTKVVKSEEVIDTSKK